MGNTASQAWERGPIIDPDIVVVMNPALVRVVDVETGLVEGGKLVVNASKPLGLKHETTYVNARRIALEILRIPIPNTVMLGAFAASTGLVSLSSLEECASQMLGWLSQEKQKANIQAIRAGYEEVKHG
jgi:pyruvate ferredoxin oxidoreductase gamma subunit